MTQACTKQNRIARGLRPLSLAPLRRWRLSLSSVRSGPSA